MSVEKSLGNFLVRLLAFFGIGIGGMAAAATGELEALRQDSWRDFPTAALSPAELAAAVVKGELPFATAASEARKHGLDEDNFNGLVLITGNPPGPMDLVALWRRGIISGDRLDHGIRQSYVKSEWLDVYHALRHLPISVADSVQAAVQNHLSYSEAVQIADGLGVAREGFDILYANAGNPPGPMELLNLWNRGYISEAEVDQGLRESRLKDKWIGPLKKLAHHKLPMRTITTLLNHGAISDTRAHEALQELGFDPTDAQALIDSSHKAKTQPHKDLSVATIKTLYTDRMIPHDQALADLTKLGYDPPTAAELLDLADAQALQRLRNATITKIRSLFVARHMTALQVSADLDKLGVPHDQRDHMIELWTLERGANVRVLTEAQVVQMGRKKILSVDEVGTRLVEMGYHEDDAALLMMLAGIIPNPNQPPT